MVLGSRGRGFTSAVLGPVARLLVRLGVSPDAVTVAGTVAVSVVALALFPQGHLVVGALVVGVIVLTDSIDGLMARQVGRTSQFGAFLDSTMDRISDSAIFAGLVLYFVNGMNGMDDGWRMPGIVAALACLVLGGLVSYARARAEGLDFTAKVGIAERADRLILALVATLAVGLGAPAAVLVIALCLLALASLYTVGQRAATVYRQATARDLAEAAARDRASHDPAPHDPASHDAEGRE
ncbi:CDP-alcohol phosphatidyltransferase family protein [Occultella glacieicola]|uniref:Phosphatidylinositol phosphate synthase n=1 Tax=Occultella glacieicola TaxID=2518684 RepID=A0ABY2E4V0_9MICO|nr:CDP-alcohol phosphatidyltransferase family protein [Occultella glacieicola]TDE92452.1 CDP-alcohol phosphatidyltransferase family protein [Occultella glacieicola]